MKQGGQPVAPDPPRQRVRGGRAAVVGLLKDSVLAVLLGVFILVFLFQPFRVEGVSMMPELADRDRVIVDKLSYRLTDIDRGDVVVFRFPEDPSKSFIKRVVGIPGDRIEIRQGVLHLNGAVLDEPYLLRPDRSDDQRDEVEVRTGFYYVLGDHRDKSFDSRFWGLVPERYIYGRVLLSYWPPSRVKLIGDGSVQGERR